MNEIEPGRLIAEQGVGPASPETRQISEREVELYAFDMVFNAFLTAPQDQLEPWEIAERQEMVDLREQGLINYQEGTDYIRQTVVINGKKKIIPKYMPFQAMMNFANLRASSDQQFRQYRQILETRSYSVVAKLGGPKSGREAKRQVIEAQELEKSADLRMSTSRVQTGIRWFVPTPITARKAPAENQNRRIASPSLAPTDSNFTGLYRDGHSSTPIPQPRTGNQIRVSEAWPPKTVDRRDNVIHSNHPIPRPTRQISGPMQPWPEQTQHQPNTPDRLTPVAVKYSVVIVDRTSDLDSRAREIAEKHLTKGLREGSIKRRIGWRQVEEMLRQDFTQRARALLLHANNIHAEVDLETETFKPANPETIAVEYQSGLAKIGAIRNEHIGAYDKKFAIEGQLRKTIIDEIILGAVAGQGSIEGLQKTLRILVSKNPEFKKLFGKKIPYFATDLLEAAWQIRNDMQTGKITWQGVENSLEISFATGRWGSEQTERSTLTDKLVKASQKTRPTGAVFNPASLGVLSSAGLWLSLRASARAMTAVPLAGAIPGGMYAISRKMSEDDTDITTHRRDRSNGEIMPDKPEPYTGNSRRVKIKRWLTGADRTIAYRRWELESFSYQTASIHDLMPGTNYDLSQEADISALIQNLAEIRARIDFSADYKVCMIRYGSRQTIEQEKLMLEKYLIDATSALETAGVSQVDIQNQIDRLKSNWNYIFLHNVEKQNIAFANDRTRKAIKAGIVGAGIGIIAGAAAHDVIVETARFFGINLGPLVIESIPSPVQSANATSEVSSLHETSNLFSRPKISYETHQVLGRQGLWEKASTPVKRIDYYANNTHGKSDGAELRLTTGKKGNALVLHMEKMGTAHEHGLHPERLNVQDYLKGNKNGVAGFYITLGGQEDGVFLPSGPDGIYSLDPNDYSHYIISSNGTKIPVGDVAKTVINEHVFNKLPNGNVGIDYYNRENALSLGLHGHPGTIQAGIMVDDEKGSRVFKSIASIHGTAQVPQEIKTNVEIQTIPTAPPEQPTPVPTPNPTQEPTPTPSARPTIQPSQTPISTPKPTMETTPSPSPKPTPTLSTSPTMRPTPIPTPEPSASAEIAPSPTLKPTLEPTATPSLRPTLEPTPLTTPEPTPTPTPTPNIGHVIIPARIDSNTSLFDLPAIAIPAYPRNPMEQMIVPNPIITPTIPPSTPSASMPAVATISRNPNRELSPQPRESGYFTTRAIESRGGVVFPNANPTRIQESFREIPSNIANNEVFGQDGMTYKVLRVVEDGDSKRFVVLIDSSGVEKKVSLEEFYRLFIPKDLYQTPVKVVQAKSPSGIRKFFSGIKRFLLRRKS